MSHTLSLVTVTAVLKDLLENGLVNDAIAASIGDVIVTALPPDRISVGTDERAQLNLFLYQVTQNRNADWIGQETRGKRLPTTREMRFANPPLALNLHYLLTAYGAKDFQSELLLGYTMQLLHETPVLTSDIIETALKNASAVNTLSVLSQSLSSVSVSDLAEKIGQIKINPEFFSMEETSKLWSSLQTNYRPSVTYCISMVAIESRSSSRYSSHTVPLSRPTVEEVTARAGATQEIVAGSILLIRGKQLHGELTRIRLSDVESLLEPQDVTETHVSLSLPPNLYSGIHGVQIVHLKLGATAAMQHCKIESNIMPFILHPTIAVSVTHVRRNGNKLYSGEISIQCNPKVGKAQRVTLLLYEASSNGAESYSFPVPPRNEETNLLAVPVNNVRAGTYLVQIQVDGTQSPLQSDRVGQYDPPQVTI